MDDYVETLEVDKRYEFSEKYNKKINKLIKHREKPYFTLICTTGRRVACFVTALLILSFSSLSVKAVREAVCDFFMNIFSDHTEIIADSEIVNSYPHSIDEEYHISSLPNGFKQVDYDKMENSIIITYFKDDDYIFFEQYTKDAYLSNYDNEQSTFESYKDENGQYPGKGDMCFVEGNVNIPVSQKMNERNQPTLYLQNQVNHHHFLS